MIDFSSAIDGGYGAGIGYNFYATVQHNGVHSARFVGNYVGGHAAYYSGVEYRESNRFLLNPAGFDYKVTRMSKIFTDFNGSVVYGQTNRDWSGCEGGGRYMQGKIFYRVGSGTMGVSSLGGGVSTYCGAYVYTIGGMMTVQSQSGSGNYTLMQNFVAGHNGISTGRPLPYMTQGGDSGSPLWIWNDKTNQFEYISAHQARGSTDSYSRGSAHWTVNQMEAHNRVMQMQEGVVAHIQGVKTPTGQVFTDNYGRMAVPYKGQVLDQEGNVLTEYVGVRTGINTWKDLSPLKDNEFWYTYNGSYFNSSGINASTDTVIAYADMMQTDDLVFVANSESTSIVVDETTDLGIGYVRLSMAAGLEHADFTISSATGSELLNSAGYIVDSDVTLHLQLTNSEDYMREWRAIVEKGAELHIEGQGDTNALLTLGREGTTYLEREGGYSAYNVYAANNAKVVIKDINQIKRDYTFGFRGGILDMNGNSMVWNNDNGADAEGFTIRAVDEQAIVANLKAGSTTTLTWTQGGARTWLGSFQDTAESALRFIYDGGEGASLVMNSIHTKLVNEGSGMDVQSGKVTLVGVNTAHGWGSFNGRSNRRYTNSDDWHYADAAMDVNVAGGATFELGSHARLTGDVEVAEGGTFIMREGVKHQMEYIEGGIRLEDTYAIRDYYGLKGNITNNGTLQIVFSSGTTATNIYAGNISGTGSMTIDTGTTGGALVLSGNNTMTGSREIFNGQVILQGAGALGTATGDNAWKFSETSWLAVEGVEQSTLPGYIHTASSGALALTQDTTGQLDMSRHNDMFLGAQDGKTVQYGEAGTSEKLAAWHFVEGADGETHGQWLLGGGGGEIVINWLLADGEGISNDLVLGNDFMGGTVTLTNINNSFTGDIVFSDAGNVVLSFTDPRALGGAKVDLTYGRAMSGGADVPDMLSGNTLKPTANGILLVDGDTDGEITLTRHSHLHIGANGADVQFTGHISVNEDATYYLGGPGTLVLHNALEANGRNDLVVDAEGFRGGAVVFNQASTITGDVTVMGYDSTLSATTGITGGDMALEVRADDALATAASVTAKDNGTLVLGTGTTQHIGNLGILNKGGVEMEANTTLYVENLQMEAGSNFFGLTPALTAMDIKRGTLSGTVNLGTITKTGEGTITVAGNNSISFSTLHLQGGDLSLDANMGGNGVVVLYNGATINFKGHTMNQALAVTDDLIVYSDVTGGTGAGGVNGGIDVAEGKTLTVSGINFAINGSNNHLVSGGTLDLTGITKVSMSVEAANVSQVFSGVVKIGNTELKSESSRENMGYEFDNLQVNGNATLNQYNWNTVWNIHSLNGEGTLTWNASTNHSVSTTLTFDAEGEFDGTVHFNRNYGSGDGSRRFQAFLEIAHDNALQNAVVKMTGGNANNFSALAINTEDAHIKGLESGNAWYNIVYGGEALTTPQADVPETHRYATLTLTGDGDYTYHGGVSGSEPMSLDLVKTGSGRQVFANGTGLGTDTASFHNVTVLGGTLELNNTTTNVYGDYTIGQGATLGIAGGLTLSNGHSIVTVGVDGQTGPAVLGCDLTLAGGTLTFEGAGMRDLADGTYFLQLGNISVAEGQTGLTVNFEGVNHLEGGRTYLLAAGDFTTLGWDNTAYTANGLDYYTANFSATSQGLSVTIAAQENSIFWAGTDAARQWTSSVFSSKEIPQGTTGFVFTDAAENRHVDVAESATFGSAVFDTAAGFTFTTDNASTMTVGSLVKHGTGDLDLQSGLRVTDSTVINKGRILLHDNALQGTISGEGTLTLASSGASAAGLGGHIATLEILAGATYTNSSSATLSYGQAIVRQGGLFSTTTGSSNVVLDGGKIYLNAASVTNLTVISDSVLENIGTTNFLGGSSLNDATLTKTGGGTLRIGSNVQMVDKLVMQQGTLLIESCNLTTSSTITLKGGTNIRLNYGAGLSGATINMEGGSYIDLYNGAGSYNTLAADINIEGTVQINGSSYGNATKINGTIVGNGVLNINRTNSNTMTFNSVLADKGETETLSVWVAGGVNAVFNGANSFTGDMSITGAVTSNNASAMGRGRLNMLGGTLTLGSNLSIGAMIGTSGTLNASGKTITITGREGENTFGVALNGCSVVKEGVGTQIFTNVGSLTSVGVAGGELRLSGSSMKLGTVLVGDEGTLTLGGNIGLANPVTSTGTVNFADSARFSLVKADFGADHLYTIVTGSGTLGADSITLDSFTIDGTSAQALADLGMNIQLNKEGGTLSLLAVMNALSWNGTAEDHTWRSGNTVWLDEDDRSTTFVNRSMTVFTDAAANKDIVVAESGVNPLDMGVRGTGYTFSGGAIQVSRYLSVAGGSSATFNNAVNVSGQATFDADSTAEFNGSFNAKNVTIANRADVTFNGDTTVTEAMTLNAGGNVIFKGVLDMQGVLTINNNANARIENSITTAQAVMLNAGGTLTLAHNNTLTLNGAGTGTLNVLDGVSVSLNTTTANYHLAGSGEVHVNPTTNNFILQSTGNTFNGKFVVDTCYSDLTIGTGNANAAPTFVETDGKYADLELFNGWGGYVNLRQDFNSVEKALKIGSLTGTNGTMIRSDNTKSSRYIAVHQSETTEFAGFFKENGQGHVGLIMNGSGTLILAGDNQSTEKLIINAGTVQLGKANPGLLDTGTWIGNIEVNSGGQLHIMRNNALKADKAIRLAGDGPTDRRGALKVSVSTTLANPITIAGDGASIFVANGATATISKTVSGSALNKLGAGTLTLNGALTLTALNVEEGTVNLGSYTVKGFSSITSNGRVNFNANTKFTLSLSDFVNLQYDVVTGSGTTGGTLTLANFIIDGKSGSTYNNITLNGFGTSHVYLTYTSSGTLVWNGTADEGGNTWAGSHWLDANEMSTSFMTLDSVKFTDAGAKNVSLGANVVTTAVSIEDSGYVFSGSALTATDGLTLADGVTATFNNTIDVTGGLTLGDGSRLIANGAFTANNVTLEDGNTLEFGRNTNVALTLAGGTLALQNNISASNVTVTADSSVEVAENATGHLSRDVAMADGAVLAKTGAGTLALDSTTTGGKYSVQEGTLALNGTYANIESVAMTNNAKIALATGSSVTTAITVDGAGVIQGAATGTATLAGTISGTGTLTLADRTTVNSAISGSLGVNVTGDTVIGGAAANTYTGGTTISGATVTANKAESFGSGVVTLSDGATLTAGTNITMGALAGGSDSTLNANNRTITLSGVAGTTTFDGSVSGISLVKNGEGVQAFTDVQSLNNVTVNGGGLTLTGTVVAVNGAVNVAETATLTLSGGFTFASTISNSGTVVFDGATISLSQSDFSADRTYTIVSGGTVSGISLANIYIDGELADSNSVTLSTTDGNLMLTYMAARDLVWNGAGVTDLWNGNNVWLNGEAGVTFMPGDNVSFTNDAAYKTVMIANLTETVNNATFTGSGYNFTRGELVIEGDLTMAGGSSATFSNGGLAVQGGITLGEGSTLGFERDFELDADISVDENGASLYVGNGRTVGLSGDIEGGMLTKTGTGTLSLTGEVGSDIDVAAGLLYINQGARFNGEVTFSGGGLKLADGVSTIRDLEFASTGTTVTLDAGATGTLAGTLSGGQLNKAGAGTLVLSGTQEAYGTVAINAGTLKLDHSASLTVTNASTGTLEVAENATADLGNVSGTANYRLAGGGDVEMNVTGGMLTLASTGSTLSGTLTIDLGNHVLVGTDNAGAAAFAEDAHPDLVLKGGSDSAGLILNRYYSGEGKALQIGSLSGESTAQIRADWGGNLNGESFRYISVNQDGDTEYKGTFRFADNDRSTGLIKNGTGTLTLSGNSGSQAKLIINEGAIALSGNGRWAGDVEVNGGTLHLQKNGALDANKGLTVDGGTIQLGNDVNLAHAVTVAERGATANVETGCATISGAMEGGALTKTGTGTLTLSGSNTLTDLTVSSGTLSLTGTNVLGTTTVADGATLSLGGGISLGSAIANSGTVDFTSGALFHLSMSDFVDNRYDVITGTGSLSGTLTKGNFVINGSSASKLDFIDLHVEGGLVYLTGTQIRSLTWTGAEGQVWGESNWVENGQQTEFASPADVTFAAGATNKDVSMTAEVKVMNMNVADSGYSFSGGAVTVVETLTMEQNSSAGFDRAVTAGGLVMEDGSSLSTTGNLTLGGDLTMGSNTKLSVGGTLDGVDAITVYDTQELELGGAFTTRVTLDGGTLSLLNGASNKLLTVTADSTLHVEGGTVRLGVSGSTAAGEKGTNFSNGAVLTKTGDGTLTLLSKAATGSYIVEGGTLYLDSFDYLYIPKIDLRTGTKLVLANQWTSLDGSSRPEILLADGSTIEMRNGNNGTRVNANISVNALNEAAIIRGIENGSNMHYEGTISGQGTLAFRSLTDGKRSGNSWAVNSAISDGDEGALKISVTDVTLTFGGTDANTFTGGVELSNSAVTVNKATAFGSGTLTMANSSTLNLGANLTVGALDVASGNTINGNGRTLTLTADSGTATFSGSLNNVSLVKSGAGVQVFSGDYNVKDGRSLTVSGGRMEVNGILGVYKGTAEIAGGTLNTTRMVMVDRDDADAALTIGRDGVLNISSGADNALIVAGWSHNARTGTLTVQDGGQLNATDAVMQVSYWDGPTGVVNIDGGSVDVKGVSFVHSQTDGTASRRRGSLTLSGHGEMTIGEAGINGVELEGSEKKVNVNLGNGTIHASSDWRMGASNTDATLADVTLTAEAPAEGKDAGTVVDTNGHKVVIDNNLTGDGSLVKDGEGTLELNGNSTYTGATTVKQGTLAVNEGASLNNGTVAVSATAEQGTLKSATLSGTSLSGLDAAHCGELDGAAITFENVTVEMRDMVISADSVIGKPAARTFGPVLSGADTPSATVLDVTNTTVVLEQSALTSTETLTAAQVVNGDLTMESGATLATLVCTNFSLDTLTGALSLDLSAFSAPDFAVDYIAVDFTGVTGLEAFTVSADIPGFGAATSVTTKENTAYIRLKTKNTDTVPEPATATLSLLALAALAARRRRRK